jgi:hypothetical protein
MPDWTLEDELGVIHVKPGLANEDYYTNIDLLRSGRSQKPAEAENDEHDLDHLEVAGGP